MVVTWILKVRMFLQILRKWVFSVTFSRNNAQRFFVVVMYKRCTEVEFHYLMLAALWHPCTGSFVLSTPPPKCNHLKGGGMDPQLVLVCPCFRENVVVTCKIESFLCSLDNFLQKNVIFFFFENQISKWRSFEKRATQLNTEIAKSAAS